ncbi:MAG: SRPBCC domain-containing protein [Chitinophagaceae bacterium]|nr:MAG: SRPBCC domain-containing protein [Chitinophagaceae bacterium]
METKNRMQIVKDLPARKLTITRLFDAAPAEVWKAWTESEFLDQWWAPKPWKAETKSMDFKEGGYWIYAMVGPDNTRHWARVDFISINPGKGFEALDTFCDENGIPNPEMPRMSWKNIFEATGGGTKLTVVISFQKDSDIQQILEMGFEQGFSSALENLDEILN